MGIQYIEWRQVVNPLSKKNCKVSLKVTDCATITTLCSVLIKELNILIPHLHRAHMQFKASKAACEEANDSSKVIAVHIEWLENTKLRQAAEEKSAYYNVDQVR